MGIPSFAFLDFCLYLEQEQPLIPWGIVKLLGGEYTFTAGLPAYLCAYPGDPSGDTAKLVGDSLGLNPNAYFVLLYLGFKVNSIAGMILAVPCGLLL